jgi:hypothetical protein
MDEIIANLDENMKGLDEVLKEFNFNFEPPEAPEPPEPPEPRGDHHHHFDYRVEPFDREPPDMRRGDGSLMDLLHNIPMDRIKSFNIKEKKDGTRITIDVSHGPVLGSSHSSERTIIIRPESGNAPGASHGSNSHKKVIIKSESEDPDEL